MGMNRLLFPLFLLFAVGATAFVLIAVVVARSPYTHANLSPEGYQRTEVTYVGEERPFQGFRLADPRLASSGDPVADGRLLFIKYGCASCHGLEGQGGALSHNIAKERASTITRRVRKGFKTMPSFDPQVLPDKDLEKIITFLKSLEK